MLGGVLRSHVSGANLLREKVTLPVAKWRRITRMQGTNNERLL